MSKTIVIDRHFSGPTAPGNGGIFAAKAKPPGSKANLPKSEEGSTVISARTTFKARGIFRLTESMVEKESHKSYEQQFQNLKQLLESQPAH